MARYDDRPRVSLRGLWRLAKTAIFSFSSLPLTIFYLIGYSALAIFVALTGYSLYCRLFTDLAIPGWTSYILSASFFGALNALGISMLGEYVLRIYDQVRGRPLYLIDRAVNLAPSAAGRQFQSATTDGALDAGASGEFEQLLSQTAELLEISAQMKAAPSAIEPISAPTCSLSPRERAEVRVRRRRSCHCLTDDAIDSEFTPDSAGVG